MASKSTPKELPKKKLTTLERRNLLRERIVADGPWNINRLAFSREVSVNYSTVQDDWKIVIDQIDPEDLKEAEIHLNKVYKKAITKTERILNDPGAARSDIIKASAVLAKLNDSFTGHQESYGRKKPVVQLVEHSGEIKTKLFAIDASQYKKKND